MPRSSQRERRVTLALKWSLIDDCTTKEIQQKFLENGYGEYALSTIRGYLSEEEGDDVLEQITAERAKVRARAIERHERKHKRARESEQDSFEREEVVAMVPVTTTWDGDGPIRVPGWRTLDPDEYPSEATDHDTRIEFTDEQKTVLPGESYPVRDVDGSPKYKPDVVAVREVPDSTERSFLRREQSHHLEQQGEAAAIYEETVNLNHGGDLSVEINQERVTEENVDEYTE